MPRKPDGRRRQTTRDERTEIIEAHARGYSYRKIEEALGVSKSTAQRVIREWESRHTTKRQKRPGPKPRLSERSVRYLARLSNKHPRATLEEITNESRLNIRPRTAGKYLRAETLWVRLARRKPWLNVISRRRRKIWCRERRSWDASIWRKKIYTDEVRLQVGSGTNARRKVRRPQGSDAAMDPRFLQPTFVGKIFGVWFWAAITYGAHTPLVVMRQRGEDERTSDNDKLGFNSRQYVDEILKPYLKPLFDACGGLENNVETVEDGASYHKSAYTTRARLQLGVKRMAWPAHSPDLNPIENVWALFKASYKKEVWRTKCVPCNEEELIAIAQRVWEGLPWGKVYRYINSMPSRVAACLRRGGGPTRF